MKKTIGKVLNSNGAKAGYLNGEDNLFVKRFIVKYKDGRERAELVYNTKFNIDDVTVEIETGTGDIIPCTNYTYYPAGNIRTLGESKITFKIIANGEVMTQQLSIYVTPLKEIPVPILLGDPDLIQKYNVPTFIFKEENGKEIEQAVGFSTILGSLIDISSNKGDSTRDNSYSEIESLVTYESVDFEGNKIDGDSTINTRPGRFYIKFKLKNPGEYCWKTPPKDSIYYEENFDPFAPIIREWQIVKKKAVITLTPLGVSGSYVKNFECFIRPEETLDFIIDYDGFNPFNNIDTLSIFYENKVPSDPNRKILITKRHEKGNRGRISFTLEGDKKNPYPVGSECKATITITGETSDNCEKYIYQVSDNPIAEEPISFCINFKIAKEWSWNDVDDNNQERPITEEWLDGFSRIIDPQYNLGKEDRINGKEAIDVRQFIGQEKILNFKKSFLGNNKIKIRCVKVLDNSQGMSQDAGAYFQTVSTFSNSTNEEIREALQKTSSGYENKKMEFSNIFYNILGENLYKNSIDSNTKLYLEKIRYRFIPSGFAFDVNEELKKYEKNVLEGYFIIPSVNNLGKGYSDLDSEPTSLDAVDLRNIESEIFPIISTPESIKKVNTGNSYVYYWTRTPLNATIKKDFAGFQDIYVVVSPEGRYELIKIKKTYMQNSLKIEFIKCQYDDSNKTIAEKSSTTEPNIYYSPIFKIGIKSRMLTNEKMNRE